MEEKVCISFNNRVDFHNQVDFCVGTGRMGLALTEEYLKQLAFVQEEIGFRHIRGHGLFSDDVSIYHEYEEDGIKKVEYNYTYLDRIFDAYKRCNIVPFLELGFMPEKLASGTQTIFYWKGNTTPPKDYSMWCDMVVALLEHLVKRYGEEVYDWPIEVWNEPNLPGFWYKADMEEYFKLFKHTLEAIKGFSPRFKVGGPAVCGGTDEVWITAFMKFCHDNQLKFDFVTRHHYTVEFPERSGHYEYHKLMNPEDGFANLKTTRDIIDQYDEYRGMPIHITEFNTSYSPQGIIHDTCLNAALIAEQLSRLGDINESYSYWTFGDVFEEMGVPFTPFHGGFGMVANGCIPKPTFWTFSFFKRLKEKEEYCIYRDKNMLVIKTKNQGIAGVAWNISDETLHCTLDISSIFSKDEPLDSSKSSNASAAGSLAATGEAVFIQKIVDPQHGNPLKIWHDLGEPSGLTPEELKLLQECAKPYVVTDRVDASSPISLEVMKDGVVYFEIKPSKLSPDRGYDYEKVISYR